MDAVARHAEGRHVFRHPLEVGAEAAGALSAGRPGGPGDPAGGRVRLGQEGGQQQHRGPGRRRRIVYLRFMLHNKTFSSIVMITSVQNI